MLANLTIFDTTDNFTILLCRDTGAMRIQSKRGARQNLLDVEEIGLFLAEYWESMEQCASESARKALLDSICKDWLGQTTACQYA